MAAELQLKGTEFFDTEFTEHQSEFTERKSREHTAGIINHKERRELKNGMS